MSLYQFIVGERYAELSALLGVPVDHDSVLTITPPLIDGQWFVENPAPDDKLVAIWWSITSPDRIVLTRWQIKQVVNELRSTIATDKDSFKRQRLKKMSPSSMESMAELAARIDQCETLMKTLMKTSSKLERIHEEYDYRYRRNLPGAPDIPLDGTDDTVPENEE